MHKVVTKELKGRLKIDAVTYWTDSMIVLRYIANEVRRFVTFVANHVEPKQWRYVQSEIHPADYASRGIMLSETRKLERWQRGPEFLWRSVEEWLPQPVEVFKDLLESDEGVKKEKTTVGAATVQTDFWNTLFLRYSTWNRLRRVVAWLIKAFQARACPWSQNESSGTAERRLKCGPVFLSVLDLDKADKLIVKVVQRQSFSIDESLLKGRFARLKPFNDEGILRVGGRLKHSDLPYDAKHPMILPGKHPVSELIIRHYHYLEGHAGSYQVLAEMRQRFWVVKGVSTVKRILGKCHVCRRQNAKLGEQITAPLPVVCVSSDSKSHLPLCSSRIGLFRTALREDGT